MTDYPRIPGIETDYLHRVYHVPSFVKTIDNTIKVARQLEHTHPFDAIAFTGTSGAAYAYPLSYHLRKPLLCLRKDTNSHFARTLEGAVNAKRFLLIDDWIATGSTMRKLVSTIRKNNPSAQFSAVLLFDKLEQASWDPYVPWHMTIQESTGAFTEIDIPLFGGRLPDEAYRPYEPHSYSQESQVESGNGYYSLDPA